MAKGKKGKRWAAQQQRAAQQARSTRVKFWVDVEDGREFEQSITEAWAHVKGDDVVPVKVLETDGEHRVHLEALGEFATAMTREGIRRRKPLGKIFWDVFEKHGKVARRELILAQRKLDRAEANLVAMRDAKFTLRTDPEGREKIEAALKDHPNLAREIEIGKVDDEGYLLIHTSGPMAHALGRWWDEQDGPEGAVASVSVGETLKLIAAVRDAEREADATRKPQAVEIVVTDSGPHEVEVRINDERLMKEVQRVARLEGISPGEFVNRSVARRLLASGLTEAVSPEGHLRRGLQDIPPEKLREALDAAISLDSDPEEPAERAQVAVPQGDETVTVPIVGPNEPSLWMPTPTLRRFSQLARDDDEELALSEEDAARLDPNGRHIVSGAAIQQGRMRSGGMHHFVRAKMLLRFKGHTPKEPETRQVDMPLKQFGLLMEGLEVEVGRHAAIEQPTLRGGIKRPLWVGSHSFDRTWDMLNSLATLAVYYDRNRADPRLKEHDAWGDLLDASLSPRALIAMDALERMQRARVLAVEVDVFEGAPEWEDALEMWRFAETTRTPFDPLYLDLTAPGGLSPLISVPMIDGEGRRKRGKDNTVVLRGALMWHEGESLIITPVGWPQDMHERLGASERGKQYAAMPDAPFGADYAILGRVVVGGRTPAEPLEWVRVRPSTPGLDLTSILAQLQPASLFTETIDEPMVGRVDVLQAPHRTGADTEEFGGPEYEEELAVAWGKITMLAAARALSVLGMLEAMNVEMEDSRPVDKDQKRAAKRAEKRGWEINIAKTVLVRPSKTSLTPREDTGEHREYSHAFWRRGHYAYYPLGTRMADKLADENPRDNRLVNHPNKGLCRKVYRGPVIVGRTDADGNERKPIEKTRVWKREGRKRAQDPPAEAA